MTDTEIKTIAAARLSVIIQERVETLFYRSETQRVKLLVIESLEKYKEELIEEEKKMLLPFIKNIK